MTAEPSRYTPISAEHMARMQAELARAEAEADAAHARLDAMRSSYAYDVCRLFDLAARRTDATEICVQILRCLHQKRGLVDLFELRRLDLTNKAVAMRLIELCGSPSMLPDSGLMGILSPDEIEALFADA